MDAKMAIMAKTTWFDRLLSLRHQPLTKPDEEVEGLVLSGGGSRASFHIGALRYLYDKCHISPTSVTATSCGSICAAMLAQSLDPDVQSANLRVLERYWLAMSDPSEMYTEQSWFTKLRQQWSGISGVIPTPDASDPAFVDTSGSDAEHLVKEAIISDPSLHDSEFSLSSMWQILGSLPRLGRVGAGMAGILRGAEHASSAFRPGPIVHRLLFESGFNADNVRTSGMKLRMAFVGLQSGELRFMREDGIIVDSEDEPVETTPFDLSLGVWASCAIPGVFRPVKLGDDMYIDGGIRENLPVEMAVNGLSVTKPYVIVAIPPGVPRVDFTEKDMLSILVRTIGLLVDETTRDEVAWARHCGATVIAPEYEVHGSMTVERGLLQINRDYGWMRAAEEIGGKSSNASTDGVSGSLSIVLARVDLYNACRGTDVEAITAARGKLRALLSEADPALLPEGYEAWPDETWA